MKVRAELLEDVRRVVRKENLVRALDIKAVLTTEQEVLQLEVDPGGVRQP